MQQDDAFMTAYGEAQDPLRAARPDQIQEALRLLACELAYRRRYHECLTVEEFAAWFADASKYATSMEILTNGVVHLAEVLRRLHVTPSQSAS